MFVIDKKEIIIFLIFFINILLINNAPSNEKDYFLTLKNNKVNVRWGPSLKYPIKFVYKKKFFPLKIIDRKENFNKIIDLYSNGGWIHTSQLTKKKSAINIFNLALIFKNPNIYSKPLARLEKGKMVIIKKCKINWCKISVENNSAWIQKKFLWGRF